MSKSILRLILGDQLNREHSWFLEPNENAIYLIAELKQETDYVVHHIQKVCAFFAAMQSFALHLKERGRKVIHLTIDETVSFENLSALIQHYIHELKSERFEYQQPDEFRLKQQLEKISTSLDIETHAFDTEHFLLPLEDINSYFEPAKHVRMEGFYRKMRKRFNVLMEENSPLGGQWNFDGENRHSFKAKDLPDIPAPLMFTNSVEAILRRLRKHEVKTIGNANEDLLWPVNLVQARALLNYFCNNLLPRFGKFQDAMTRHSEHSWSLYHSRLSFALNAKIISPSEVIDTAVNAYYESEGAIDLSQIEGFVRQILGWREYVRGIYWANMPQYTEQNYFQAKNRLPKWFWDGQTNMACMQAAVTQSLDYAYAHHIQRLMITGNFTLLAGIDPAEVDAWYLGIYVDAIEWVELPNTRGMALFADGGWIATKPYAASGNYVNKMSDYCKHCRYAVKKKTEPDACPLNSLYWDFIDRNFSKLEANPRMAFPIKNWRRQTMETKKAVLAKAKSLMEKLDEL